MYTSIYCTSILLTKVLAIFNFFQPYLFDFIRLLIGQSSIIYLHILCNRAVVACYLRRYFLLLTNNAVRQL